MLLKSADLEPANQPSSRISSSTPEELVTRRVGSEDVVALKSSEADLAIAERFPEQSFVRPLNHEAMSDPLGYRLNGKQVEYPKPFREAGDTAVTDELNYYKEVSDAEMSKEFDAALNRLESFTPNKELDVGPGLGADAAERVKIKDEIASIKEEKSAWQALKSCLVGN